MVTKTQKSKNPLSYLKKCDIINLGEMSGNIRS